MYKKVLILEDNIHTPKILAELVIECDLKAKVLYTSSIEEAYKFAIEDTIDVFIIDIILQPAKPEDISGLKFAKALRRIERYYFTPMIFITALEDPELYAYRDLHCFGYIEKPFSEEHVKSLLSEALYYETKKIEDSTVYLRKDGILYAVKLFQVVYIQVQHHKMLFMTEKVVWYKKS